MGLDVDERAISREALKAALTSVGYIADDPLITTLYLSLRLGKPLLLEGEPGCGKTELAKSLSEAFNRELIRLQCYEGLDSNSAIYEWDYLRQLLKIRMLEASGSIPDSEIFSERFILKRPLLRAVTHEGSKPPVLLIDEVDRADEEFEGFLLEFLAEFQVTVPELGSFKAEKPPIVVITSNQTRELGDGLRRRCLYYYVGFPTPQRELEILKAKVSGLDEALAKQIVGFVGVLREGFDLAKKPGVAETIDWARALISLDAKSLEPHIVRQTLSCLIKDSSDTAKLSDEVLERVVENPKAATL
ncbi:MAG: MoxR family ATPase, partial [Thermoprotei archaeon]